MFLLVEKAPLLVYKNCYPPCNHLYVHGCRGKLARRSTCYRVVVQRKPYLPSSSCLSLILMNTFPTTSTQVVSLESLPFYSYLDDQGFVNFQDSWGKVTVYAIYDAQYQLQYIGKSRDTRTSLLLHLLRQPNDCYYFKYYAVEKPSRTALDQMRQVWMDQMKEQPPVGNVDEFIQSRWEGPIDVQKYGLVTEEEEEQLKQADENDKSKLLKQICRRVQRNIEQELKERGVNELIRWDPKLKEKGLLDGQSKKGVVPDQI